MILTKRKAATTSLKDALEIPVMAEPLLASISDSETESIPGSACDESDFVGDEESSMEGSESKLKIYGGHAHLTHAEIRLQKWLHFAHSNLVQTHGVRALLACLAVVFPVLYMFIADAHNLCDFPSKNNCEPRNFLMNLDIQILTGLFTIKAIICFPWRAAALWHLLCNCDSHQWMRNNPYFPARCHALGHDFFGQLSEEPFFRIPHRPRLFLALLNVGDCVFQLLNQATRVYFYTYASANTAPGNFWVDFFWPCSFVCGVLGGNLTDRWIKHINNNSNNNKTGFDKSSSGNYQQEQEQQPAAPSVVLDLYRQHGPNPYRVATALYQHIREGSSYKNHKEEDQV